MSTRLRAFIPDTDALYQKMKKVYLACEEAKMDLPEEAAKYFGVSYPEDDALEQKLTVKLTEGIHYVPYFTEMTEGFEIDLDKLPKGVTKIRFTNSF